MTKRDRAALLKELEELMRDTSEEEFSAGWHHDLEFWLWADLYRNRCYGWSRAEWALRPTPMSLDRRFLLAQASALLGGWLRWDHDAHAVKFVPYDAWIVLYAAWKKKGKKR
jgi:hypothetical protein